MHRRHLAFFLLPFSAILLTACGGVEPAQEPVEIYEVRGMVRQLPKAPRAGAEMRILHEALPEFRSETGEVVGMESMSMPFPVAQAELLEGLAVGDRVRFEFEVRWQGKGSPLLLTRIEKLPTDTRLDFEAPPEEAGEEAEAGSQDGEEASIEGEHDGDHGG